MAFIVPEKFRIKHGQLRTTSHDGNNGAFMVSSLKLKQPLFCIASDGMGWEHVSVSLSSRCPTWDEMCVVKYLFWGDDDCVVQFHPPKADYVNFHPYCLHLWRAINQVIPVPQSILVGIK